MINLVCLITKTVISILHPPKSNYSFKNNQQNNPYNFGNNNNNFNPRFSNSNKLFNTGFPPLENHFAKNSGWPSSSCARNVRYTSRSSSAVRL